MTFHTKTEKRLLSEGYSAIRAAISASSDVSRLHDKLDCKMNVDYKNTDMFQNFQSSYAAFQKTLRQELVSTSNRHTDALKTHATQ